MAAKSKPRLRGSRADAYKQLKVGTKKDDKFRADHALGRYEVRAAVSNRGAVCTADAPAWRLLNPGLEGVEGQARKYFDWDGTTRCHWRSRRGRRACTPHNSGAHSSLPRNKMAPLHASRVSAPSNCRGCVWVAVPRLIWRTQTSLPRGQAAERNQHSTCRMRT